MKPTAYQILARYIALRAVRNGILEGHHTGITPVSEAGDYRDVVVVTPSGSIPWNEVSRLSDEEMRVLMLQVEEEITKCLETIDTLEGPEYQRFLKRLEQELFGSSGISWDRPNKPDRRTDDQGKADGLPPPTADAVRSQADER